MSAEHGGGGGGSGDPIEDVTYGTFEPGKFELQAVYDLLGDIVGGFMGLINGNMH